MPHPIADHVFGTVPKLKMNNVPNHSNMVLTCVTIVLKNGSANSTIFKCSAPVHDQI